MTGYLGLMTYRGERRSEDCRLLGRGSQRRPTPLVDVRIQIIGIESHVPSQPNDGDPPLADKTADEVLRGGQVLGCLGYVKQASTLDGGVHSRHTPRHMP